MASVLEGISSLSYVLPHSIEAFSATIPTRTSFNGVLFGKSVIGTVCLSSSEPVPDGRPQRLREVETASMRWITPPG